MLIKVKNIYLVFVLLIFITTACSKEETNVIEKDIVDEVITDALGNKVVLKDKPERVVSLVGSYAEIWTLAGGNLVGVTDDVEKENRMEITDDIKVVGTIKEPNVEEVLALNPDFV
ncbi:MAG TPA: ABC transporter substrate-binding protein, partial [Clostridiales bacterium]|nr:ABC transporter substrate-binding protein [Clostridiales bacterium]